MTRPTQRTLSRAARAATLAAGAATIAAIAAPTAAEAAYSNSTADNCTWYGFNDATANTDSYFDAWTGVQTSPSGNDPDCTGYVEVKCHTNGNTYTSTSGSGYIGRSCIDNAYKSTDHNARATTGTLWGFGLSG